MPRTSNNTPDRDDDGRFTSDDQSAQARGRNDDTRSSSSQGRGWHGDSEGHAEAGSHSHDSSRGTSQSRSNDDDDRRTGNRVNDRDRDDDGRFASASRGGTTRDDEADYGAWHAYGHARGYHGYQRRGSSQASDNRGQSSGEGRGRYADSDRNANAGSQGYDNNRGTTQSRPYDDDYNDRQSGGNNGGNRQRDNEGRFTGNRH